MSGSAERGLRRSRKRTIREEMRGKSGSEGDWLFKQREIPNTQD